LRAWRLRCRLVAQEPTMPRGTATRNREIERELRALFRAGKLKRFRGGFIKKAFECSVCGSHNTTAESDVGSRGNLVFGVIGCNDCGAC